MKIQFDNTKARSYRKRSEVLAFQTNGTVIFHKAWAEQNIRPQGWILIPLTETGATTQDIYGCDADAFKATYEPSPSLKPNHYRKTEKVRAYQPGIPFEVDTVLPDGHVEVKNAKLDANDAWIVQAPSGETYPIENIEFKRTYIEVPERSDSGYKIRSRDEHWASDGAPKRILALDGGGVRGILTLGYLERIETILRERHGNSKDFRLSHYFDLIAGTSTGAIIAACLAKGMPVGEVIERYKNVADDVFKPSFFRRGILRARYSANALKSQLDDVFRNDTLGSKALQTGLLVVTKRLDTGSIWPLSNNPKAPYFTKKRWDDFLPNKDYPLGSVVRASTAAPSYFVPKFIEISQEKDKPHGDFVDGGASPHNNPALLALQLALLKGHGANWQPGPDKLLLVSVGTGSAQPGTSNSWFAFQHAVKSLLSMMDDCSESTETILQWLSDSPTSRQIDTAIHDLKYDLLAERPLIHYLRYNVQLNSRWLKDNLGKSMSDDEAKKLQAMDRPEHMPLLYDLGVEAAKLQIAGHHFPPGFDLM